MLDHMAVCICCVGLLLPLSSCGGGGNSSTPNTAIPLEVVSTVPADNAATVPLDNSIGMTFSAEIDSLTVNGSTVGLFSAAEDIPVTVSISGNAVTINPAGKLCLQSKYTAMAKAGIKDRDGNALATDFSWSFTTRDGTWGSPARVDNATGVIESPRIAVNRDGIAVAVWAERVGVASNQQIWVNRYVPEIGWEGPRRIELDDLSDNSPAQIGVGIDEAGNAIAVWTQWAGSLRLWTNRYVVGTGWQTAELLEQDSKPAMNPQLAMDPQGNALVTWLRWDFAQPDNSVILFRRYEAGTGWGSIQTLVASGRPNYAPISMDDAGNAIALWEQWDGTRYDVWAARYSVDSGWGTPQRIESSDGTALAPSIAMDRQGNGMATWQQSDGVRNHIWAARYAIGSGWGTAQRVDTNDALECNYPMVAVGENGNTIIGWRAYNGMDMYTTRTWANTYAQGSGWGTPKMLSSDNVLSDQPRVGMDSNGNALAVWRQWDATGINLWSNRFGTDIGWGSSQLTEMIPDNTWLSPALAVHSCGSALVVWPQGDSVSADSVWTARFE